jgi:hypothetical protein
MQGQADPKSSRREVLPDALPDTLIPPVCFGVATAIGLAAAFVGLTVSSLWQDELYTGWIVEPAIGWAGTVARALHDVGPPLYYLLLWPFVQLLGDGEIGLRLFSTLCAVASILLFVLGGASFFGLRARLFAAAMAAGSSYWFMQAQNARFYALALLISTGLLLLGLAALRRDRSLGGLFVLMAAATFTHFYLLFESLAVLMVLALYRPRRRVLLISFGGLLLISALLYVKFVISRLSYASTGENWIPNELAWYVLQLRATIQLSLTHKAMLALVVCAIAGAAVIVRHAKKPGLPTLLAWVAARGDLALCVAVPAIVLAGGVASSFVVTPNFHSRYLLICSPFLWGLVALCYDRSVETAPVLLRRGANLALSAIVLWMAVTMALTRDRPIGEPFRESAAEIKAIPACRGETLPAVVGERKRWFRSPEALQPIRAAYAKYLQGFADPQLIYAEDILSGNISDDWKKLLRERIDGSGCPVLAWTVHTIPRDVADEIGAKILAATDRQARAADLGVIVVKDGFEGYVLTMKRGAR